MGYTLSDITFLIRLLLDILVVWGFIYSGTEEMELGQGKSPAGASVWTVIWQQQL